MKSRSSPFAGYVLIGCIALNAVAPACSQRSPAASATATATPVPETPAAAGVPASATATTGSATLAGPSSSGLAALVGASMTIAAAAEVPANPLTDKTLDDNSPLSNEIRWGFRLFTNTPVEAKRLTPSRVACSNCHLNAGQRDHGLPVVGLAGVYPEYNKRTGRLISLDDRIVECFLRSENGTGRPEAVNGDPTAEPTTGSPEVLAISAYLTWLSRGYRIGTIPPWRGKNTIAPAAQIPPDRLDRHKGETIYNERCAACHGLDGEGIVVGDRRPAPLWGPRSWNDGAGAARIYSLAGIIRYTMPYVTPGSLTDQEAQEVAAFITSKPRPAYPLKGKDYPSVPVPPDAVYYSRRAIPTSTR